MARQARRHAPALVLALATVGAVLAGCAGAGAESESPFPARPAEIDISTLDPCSALTGAQQRALGLDRGEPATVDLASGPSRTCMWSNFDEGANYTVQTVDESASAAVGVPGTTIETVAGFGAVRVTASADTAPLCELYIDAADGQSLRVQLQHLGNDENGAPRSMAEVCGRAVAAATDTITNALRGTR